MLPLRRHLPIAALGSLAFIGAVATPAGAAVTPRQALLETTSWAEFDQTNTSTGTLAFDKTRAFNSTQSAKAVFSGGSNGFSRGIFNTNWQDGDEVTYGAAFYLPTGFKSSMQGQVDLLRWDNYTVDPTNTDRSGIVIYNSDKRARVIRQKLGVEQVPLADAFDLPEGRWFHLEVHQKLSKGSGALTEVYLDGTRILTSTVANTYGRGVTRIRTGIVAIDAGRQTNPLTLWFDKATVDTKVLGPGTTTPPPTTTEPAPTTTTGVVKPGVAFTASSLEKSTFTAANGGDAKSSTRWSSRYADTEWWRADLGRLRSVSEVQVDWEAAYASRYAIDVSSDGTTWTTAAEQGATAAGTVKTTFAARSARYVRVRGIARGTTYGISFWEARILGAAD